MTWATVRLGDEVVAGRAVVQTGPFGSQLHQHDYVDDGVPVVMPKDIVGGDIDLSEVARVGDAKAQEMARHSLAAGDIVFPRRGDIRKCALVTPQTEGALCGTGCLKIRIDRSIYEPTFLYYLLSSDEVGSWLEGRAVGTTMLNLSAGILNDLEISAPPLQVQTAIVSTVSAYDDLIDNNRRRIKLLEDSVRLLFDEWFRRCRFPGHDATPVLDGLPAGWVRDTLGAVVVNQSRRRIPLSSFEREARPGPYPYHGAAGVLDYLDRYIFEGRHLLVGEDGTVQTAAGTPMLQLVEGKFWVSNHAHVLQGGTLSTEFLYCFLAAYPIAGHITGVAQPKLTQGNLNRIPVVVPPADLRSAFQQIADPIFEQIFVLRAQMEKLRTARDLLLPRLMSGELVV
ncbi:MAG: restriction endonuclease subunit S [Burkholderiaceae bacterium]|jgi:type I restriction enzyme S subunit|nr:restriction endonuclease subunit S [Burkholderiaceae bacterium]MCU0965526.1 restriction endonuclease subunit S [Burkholderiaceae bacterium]